jgi:LmbE family N-acetylglucosaminyl deacetylase
VDSVLVMATRGERGTCGEPPLCSIEELPGVREAELRAAARYAGFVEVIFLGYEDQQLANAPEDEIRRKLVTILRAGRPMVVVTFDPEGGNRHPDHVAISRFTSDAIAAAGDARWYRDAGPPHAVRRLLWTPCVRPWEITTVDLADAPGVDFAIDTSRYVQQRADALRAHRTQRQGIDRLFLSRPDLRQILSVEVFRQAWGPALPSRPADDVFAGIV